MAKPCRRGCKYPRRKKAPVNPPVSLAADRSGLPLRSLHLPPAALPCGPFTQGGLWYGGMNGLAQPLYSSREAAYAARADVASAPTGKSLPDTFYGGTLLPQARGRAMRAPTAEMEGLRKKSAVCKI